MQKLENVQVSNGVGEGKEGANMRSKRNANLATYVAEPARERWREKPNSKLRNPPKHVHGEQVVMGWPPSLSAVSREAIKGWIPCRADAFEKLDKVSDNSNYRLYCLHNCLGLDSAIVYESCSIFLFLPLVLRKITLW